MTRSRNSQRPKRRRTRSFYSAATPNKENLDNNPLPPSQPPTKPEIVTVTNPIFDTLRGQTSPPKKRRVCRYFASKTGCKRGSGCTWLHVSLTQQKSQPPIPRREETSRLPLTNAYAEEGNLCFSQGRFREAKWHFSKALWLNRQTPSRVTGGSETASGEERISREEANVHCAIVATKMTSCSELRKFALLNSHVAKIKKLPTGENSALDASEFCQREWKLNIGKRIACQNMVLLQAAS